METIRNKVEESGLIQLDLADFKPVISIVEIDIAHQLWQGLILKEREFRAWIKLNEWISYKDKAVCIYCSADAIVPTWAFMLVASQLTGIAAFILTGTREELEKALIKQRIEELDLSIFKDGRIIIKGCSDIDAPAFAMCELLTKIQPVAKSIMYGEPCSTVPIYKRN
jgi:hypothetical protein